MTIRMYFVATNQRLTDETSRDLQRFVRDRGGLILMVTVNGPIVTLDESQAPMVEQHPLVQLVGPVNLNPRGVAAAELQRIFEHNLSQQLTVAPAKPAQ
jgi:hypothetical protein